MAQNFRDILKLGPAAEPEAVHQAYTHCVNALEDNNIRGLESLEKAHEQALEWLEERRILLEFFEELEVEMMFLLPHQVATGLIEELKKDRNLFDDEDVENLAFKFFTEVEEIHPVLLPALTRFYHWDAELPYAARNMARRNRYLQRVDQGTRDRDREQAKNRKSMVRKEWKTLITIILSGLASAALLVVYALWLYANPTENNRIKNTNNYLDEKRSLSPEGKDEKEWLHTMEQLRPDDMLKYAIVYDNELAFHQALSRDADIQKPDLNGRTPLILTVVHERHKMAGLLLGRGADPNRLNARGWSALHFAVSVNDLEMARLLMSKGADPFLSGDGTTPMALAKSYERSSFEKLFMEVKVESSEDH